MIDGQERVREFASRALTRAERNYSVTERECLAILWAIEKFRAYVEGYNFLVVTDHSSLRWIRSLRSPTGHLAWWAFRIQMHNFDVEHRKGSLNCVPDTLFRMFEEDEEEEVPAIGAVSWATTTKDDWYLDWQQKVRDEPNRFPRWKVLGGQLYTYRPNLDIEEDLGFDDDAWKMVVPKEEREKVLSECHEESTAGHLGREKTFARVARYAGQNITSQ